MKKNPYIINIGGTGVTGVWSYIEAFQEMVDQVRTVSLNVLVCS